MKISRKILMILKVFIFALILSSCATSQNVKTESNSLAQNAESERKTVRVENRREIPDNEAMRFAQSMLIGWNLGNSMDAHNNGVASETAWGNPRVNESLIKAVSEAGFKTIRIPISWMNSIGKAPEYKVSESRLKRIEEVCLWAKNAGLKVIINVHHDGADANNWLSIKAASEDESKKAEIEEKLTSLWKQIARYFSGTEDYLVFEVMNEIHDGGWGWSGNRNDGGKQYKILNEWNQMCVDAIRSTGSKNFISVPGYVTNISLTIDNLVIPSDSLNRIMVTVHFYDPNEYVLNAKFQMWGAAAPAGKKPGWGDENNVKNQFKKLYDKYVSQGIPVIIGEYGAVHQKGYEDFRRYYMEYVTKTAYINGLIPVYWDNGSGKSGNECSGLFQRSSGSYFPHSKLILDAMMKAVNEEYTEIVLPVAP